MTIWWEALSTLQRFFALLAVPATLLLLVQTVLLLSGMSGDGDGDAELDLDGDGIPDDLEVCDDPDCDHDHGTFHDYNGDGVPDHALRVFSLRTIVAFFAVFGWSGIVLTKGGLHEGLAAALAFMAGGLAMLGLAWLLKLVLDMQTAGNLDPSNAIGREGTVYLPIPPGRSGAGKVTILVQGRYAELGAVTDCQTPLRTGVAVTVLAVSEEAVLVVAPTEENKFLEMGGT